MTTNNNDDATATRHALAAAMEATHRARRADREAFELRDLTREDSDRAREDADRARAKWLLARYELEEAEAAEYAARVARDAAHRNTTPTTTEEQP